MVPCILCLKNITFLKNSICLNSNEGRELNIFKILTTILNFLQLNSETKKNERICCDCWNTVENFNNFCQRILAAHKSGTALLLINDDVADPISNENLETSFDNSSLSNFVNGQNNVFSAMNEIKVEVDELDLLPSIEVLENPVNTNNRNSPPPPLPKQDYIISSMNANGKLIKSEEPVSNLIDDSVSDFSFSDYLSNNDNESIQSIKLTNDTKYGKQKNCEDGQESETNISYSTIDNENMDNVEIPKHIIVKPKKSRKTGKPLVRLSHEEIDKSQAQQKEYDELIVNFFENFSCPVCNVLVKDFSGLKSHFRITHDSDSCFMSCCGRKFHTRKLLAEHVLVHWNPEHFKCNTCKCIFQDSRSFRLHENAHKNPDKKVYQCDKCSKSYTRKAKLEYHTNSKHAPKSEFIFSCKDCNKKFAMERHLKDHMKYTHNAESVICDKCGKKMCNQSSLKTHYKLKHSDEPRPEPVPMQCEICSKWFRHLTGLKQHMKSVHNEADEDHRCHICNRTSPTARALQFHIYSIHKCEAKFKCTMCDKAFKRPHSLREHKSIHMGEPLYTCPNCPLTFFSSANMYKHRQRSHRAEWESDKKKPNVNIMKQATRLREVATTEKFD